MHLNIFLGFSSSQHSDSQCFGLLWWCFTSKIFTQENFTVVITKADIEPKILKPNIWANKSFARLLEFSLTATIITDNLTSQQYSCFTFHLLLCYIAYMIRLRLGESVKFESNSCKTLLKGGLAWWPSGLGPCLEHARIPYGRWF